MGKIFIFCALLLTACQKNYLDRTPYSAVSSATMWTSDNLTDLGVAGVYNGLRLGMGNSSNGFYFEIYALDRFSSTTQSRFDEPLLNGTITAGDGVFSTFWKNFYEGIQRANDAIKNIPEKSPSPAAKKARYIAECKFLRAYFYSRLNQLYKGVPIYLEPFTPAQATKARSTEAQVWNQVITDLTDCINEANLPAIYASGNADYGHVTKGAAYALRGKAYMYLKKWDLAAADFNEVKKAGYALFNDYSTLFTTANERCSEMIFSIQNISQPNAGGSFQVFVASRSAQGFAWNYFMPSPNLVDLYENRDGSRFNWDAVLPGYTSLTPAKREVYFLRDNLTAGEITAAKNRGAEMSLYLPNGNEARIKQAYVNRDPRLQATVITPYAAFDGAYSNTTTPTTSYLRWPYRAQALVNGDFQTDTQNFFYYMYRKFVATGTSEIISRDYAPVDAPLIRYADVLLMWAEALNEQGLTNDAIDLVNQVRGRAGVALLNSNAATTVTGKDDMRIRIRNERRVEFPIEGVTYFDELRWGAWKDNVFFTGNGRKQVWGGNVASYSFKADYIYTWPIPLSDIVMNPSLEQNFGWIN
ncbi:RagB/SusD family nutrient uptake outer membrane protein [Filimonas effusa]|uniref:RagB/SusD family nutrient uptake outer membrane protein n=1 Tax=Filimonas effusa TaxID=2508721 RepID=A0A4Q1DAY8_9BACT|nr:RagB/SusD family nutrient uptake outer membrane protein [Filimonas effusa]RXK86604.1 RagB/SusD family nutrient uptake outer membrane protein [Filimonas effusa]